MLKENEEQVFLAFEVGIDCALTPACPGGDFIELGTLISVAYKHLFRGIEKPGLCLPGPNLLLTQCFHGTSLIKAFP
jgi:hypothetical protein